MTKPEVLKVVKQMHDDWCFAKQFSFFSSILKRVRKKNVNRGFCWYLKKKRLNLFSRSYFIRELKKDLVVSSLGSDYWYDVFNMGNSLSENRKALQLRIDHLQRTITRLENEIKSEN